ncbi:two-component sensor histidine kinase [Vibrio ponticus]|uniref:histidine kinase n=1 Tax=Vibrio ponticus TaxID=265668 RepID=A0ABX3FHW0_9VIBR|nr:HAMP domain-containing sensor histidine kinase [Vibrio ponticus]OLQ92786.1 two-component sensor histidine kinase [Vibrio ponticus]
MGKATDLKHKHHPSIYRKIRRSFGLMTLLMFSIFWGVIYFAENQIEILSLHHWLDTEAERYKADYQIEGELARLPQEAEFSTYWSERDLPVWLKTYHAPGFYEHLLGEEDKHFLVTAHPSGKGMMYIVFQDDADDYLDDYELSLHNYTFLLGGFVSLLVVLYGFNVVRSLSKPLSRIEEKIRQMPPSEPIFEVDTKYAETRHIEQALLDSKRDIAGFFQREKEFSRFASHELRTPIMVVRGSTDLLAKVADMPPVAQKAISRLDHASEQMRILTETFLLLGKESIDDYYFSHCDLNVELDLRLEEMAPLFAKQDASFELNIEGEQKLYAPPSFVTIVINNLIKNAFSYSVGEIEISLIDGCLIITNRHDGNETYNAGYGCGLVIVERICERMNWVFSTQDDGQQFTAQVYFT